MIDFNTYEIMKQEYGHVGSWTIWEPPTSTPKSNTNNMDWVNKENLLEIINTKFVFVGLNWSSTHGDQTKGGTIPWANFHSGYTYQNDYKLRYALSNTRYWGSYITDLIKLYAEVDSSKVKSYLKKNPEVVHKNIMDFEKEISYLGDNLVLVALGTDVYKLLNEYFGHKYDIAMIKHYSYTIGKEDYRKEVLDILERY